MDEDLKQVIEATAAESRRHFDVVAEGMKQQFQLVAEGVSSIGERTDRLTGRFDSLEEGMHREFEEVRSMIRLSYTELDRRLRSLEETVGTLQARMNRLESSSTQ
ncbi:MAG: hypothetical protein ABI837_13685 [Acidobacteriota bacterium]